MIAATVLVAVLSYWPARNLLSRGQMMNVSFNRLHLVNSYGAFGSINRMRLEVVVEGTDAAEPGPGTVWKEYGFKGKPTDRHRLPRQFAPYHLRLDWLMWFAGISPAYAWSWFIPFVGKLLENDPRTLRLLRSNPFPHAPPTYVRARLYHYRFTDRRTLRATGAWWERSLVREYLRRSTAKACDARAGDGRVPRPKPRPQAPAPSPGPYYGRAALARALSRATGWDGSRSR